MYNYAGEDAGLVNGIIAGSEQAFTQAYEKYHRQLYYFALKFVKSEELAAEVVHDVFLKVWEHRSGLKEELSFRAYLLTICKNQILNLLKRASREALIRKKILEQGPWFHEETEQQVHFSDYYRVALRAIEELPPQRRLVFRLCKLEGKSYEEVAEHLGISKGTVRDHMFKANRHVKQYISTYSGLG